MFHLKLKIMKVLTKIVAFIIILVAFGVGIWCFCSINDKREASDNVILVGSGVTVPVLTLFLTFNPKTSNSNSK